MHPRTALRRDFKDRLLNATKCEDRVFATMTPPVELEGVLNEEGPVMMVFVRDEEMREEDYPTTRIDGAVRRRLNLSIEVLATGSMVDDLLDDIAEQIEALLESFDPPSSPSAEMWLKDTQIDVTDVGERLLGGLFMSYEVKYFTPYRAEPGDGWLPDDVFAAIRGDARDILIDGPGND